MTSPNTIIADMQAEIDALRKERDKLLDSVSTAYGYLWHVNNEPGTPNQYSPDRASYEARRILRDMMTTEQRGEAINRVRASIYGFKSGAQC
jgi:hypothetical protein